jgi:hypothetical protein
MPAKSKKQRRLMAIAEHHPDMLYKKNKSVAKMSKSQLHDFAKTKEKKLPMKKHTAMKKKIASGNMSGKDSGSPFGKGVRAAFHTSSMIKTKKRKKK